MKLFKELPKIIIMIFVTITLCPNLAHANSLYPYKNEVKISSQERTRESFSFKNDEKKTISIFPYVYTYNPQTLQIYESQEYTFLRVDQESKKVSPNSTISINYEVVPPNNLEPGTYFNLIVLRKEDDPEYIKSEFPVGISDSLSHLVVLHVVENEEGVYGITSEFAFIDIEILENGIPFIRPTRVKYTIQNITNYVLSPKGEIQIYNKKGAYAPIYLKINTGEKKLYPGGILEEEFDIDKYDITDLFNERIIIGRFYNGIDENFIIKDTTQQPNYIVIIISGLSLIMIAILIKSVFKERVIERKSKVSA